MKFICGRFPIAALGLFVKRNNEGLPIWLDGSKSGLLRRISWVEIQKSRGRRRSVRSMMDIAAILLTTGDCDSKRFRAMASPDLCQAAV